MNITPKNGLTDKFRPPATKVCRLCKDEKPIGSFSQNIKNKDGYMHECRACMKDREDQKVQQRKENAKTFFDAKYFTLFFLLLSTSAFSQDTARQHIDLKAQGWIGDTIPPYCNTAGVTLITYRPDTVRAIILATMCRKCAAEAIQGYVVLQQGKRPVYLNRCKQALRGSQVGWDWREVGGKER